MVKKYTYIKCGNLFDGEKKCFQKDMKILVENNIIKEVGSNIECPESAEVVDLSDASVTPGLIDAHVHFNYMEWQTFEKTMVYENQAWKGMAVLYNARKGLSRGFTAYRHCGTNSYDGYASITAKRLIDDGHFPGARMCVAPYYITCSNSHGDNSHRLRNNPDLGQKFYNEYPGYGCGPIEFRNIVRTQIKYGADFIKIFCNGGFSTPNDSPDDLTLMPDELTSIFETAHQLKKTVTAHAYSTDTIRLLVELGIDGIEHGSCLDDPDVIKMMEDKNVYLLPNFTVYDPVINYTPESIKKLIPSMQKKIPIYADRMRKARELILSSNLRIGYGTDFVAVHNAYESGYEYGCWIESGVNAFNVLYSATHVNAEILGMKKIGAIKPGYFADIAAWKRDLLHDPKALLDCYWVMKDGVIYPTEKAEDLAD